MSLTLKPLYVIFLVYFNFKKLSPYLKKGSIEQKRPQMRNYFDKKVRAHFKSKLFLIVRFYAEKD